MPLRLASMRRVPRKRRRSKPMRTPRTSGPKRCRKDNMTLLQGEPGDRLTPEYSLERRRSISLVAAEGCARFFRVFRGAPSSSHGPCRLGLAAGGLLFRQGRLPRPQFLVGLFQRKEGRVRPGFDEGLLV